MFKFYRDTQAQQVTEGVTRRILAHNGKMMSVEVAFETGATGPMHHHPHEQLTYVLSGKFQFTINGESHLVQAGDTLYKAPNIEHGCVCLETGKLLDIFTPQREDFL